MTYYFSKQLEMPFDQAVEHVTDALAAKGFGVLTTIDVRATIEKAQRRIPALHNPRRVQPRIRAQGAAEPRI